MIGFIERAVTTGIEAWFLWMILTDRMLISFRKRHRDDH